MARLSDKVAIITGTASGMGLAAARLFTAEGAKVVMVDIAEEALEEAARAITADGGDVTPVTMDVSSAEAWENAVARTIEAHGRVDILVNNAALVTQANAEETDEAEWDTLMGVNAKSVWLGIKNVVPHMRTQGGGSIVNTASIAGIVGGKGSMTYSASKGAVLAMGRSVAEAYAKDSIRVNAILPGLVYTGMTGAAGTMTKEQAGEAIGGDTPLPPHVGDADDIAYAMLYLGSDESKYVTGAELVVDGGWTVY